MMASPSREGNSCASSLCVRSTLALKIDGKVGCDELRGALPVENKTRPRDRVAAADNQVDGLPRIADADADAASVRS